MFVKIAECRKVGLMYLISRLEVDTNTYKKSNSGRSLAARYISAYHAAGCRTPTARRCKLHSPCHEDSCSTLAKDDDDAFFTLGPKVSLPAILCLGWKQLLFSDERPVYAYSHLNYGLQTCTVLFNYGINKAPTQQVLSILKTDTRHMFFVFRRLNVSPASSSSKLDS
jgi:hypothetical protein